MTVIFVILCVLLALNLVTDTPVSKKFPKLFALNKILLCALTTYAMTTAWQYRNTIQNPLTSMKNKMANTLCDDKCKRERKEELEELKEAEKGLERAKAFNLIYKISQEFYGNEYKSFYKTVEHLALKNKETKAPEGQIKIRFLDRDVYNKVKHLAKNVKKEKNKEAADLNKKAYAFYLWAKDLQTKPDATAVEKKAAREVLFLANNGKIVDSYLQNKDKNQDTQKIDWNLFYLAERVQAGELQSEEQYTDIINRIKEKQKNVLEDVSEASNFEGQLKEEMDAYGLDSPSFMSDPYHLNIMQRVINAQNDGEDQNGLPISKTEYAKLNKELYNIIKIYSEKTTIDPVENFNATSFFSSKNYEMVSGWMRTQISSEDVKNLSKVMTLYMISYEDKTLPSEQALNPGLAKYFMAMMIVYSENLRNLENKVKLAKK